MCVYVCLCVHAVPPSQQECPFLWMLRQRPQCEGVWVWVDVCVCVCVCVYMLSRHTRKRVLSYGCYDNDPNVREHWRGWVGVCLCMCVYLYLYMCTCLYVCKCVCMCACCPAILASMSCLMDVTTSPMWGNTGWVCVCVCFCVCVYLYLYMCTCL